VASDDGPDDDKDYHVVTVFYGTDRQALAGPPGAAGSSAGWFYWAAVAGGVTALLGALALWRRRRWMFGVAGVGLAGSLGLAALGAIDFFLEASAPPGPKLAYGNERGELQMGTCEVTIPKRHEVGQVERPSVFHFEFREDPTKHVVLTDVERLDDEKFFAALRDRVAASPDKEAFVFIHGYNVTFEAAARRTAQLAFDLKFEGAPIFYSWPSQGGILQYSADETNAVWAAPDLKRFLTAVAQESGAESVHVIAHSMGNRVLGSALQSLAYEMGDQGPLFNQVVLTAPDIDADVFKRDIAPAIVRTAERITLYASSNDKALALSKQVHRYPRAGDSGQGLVVVPGIDTIDVSKVDTSLLGHSYYGSNRTVLADLVDLLHGAKPPSQRPFLHPMHLGELAYWVFVTEAERIGTALGSPPPVR
jgi:esterase/lipase superfamily enzyme